MVVSFLRTVLWITLLLALLLFSIPFGLAIITLLRQQLRKAPRFTASALYAGRVWHTRHRPIRHAFAYPFIIFGLHFDDCCEENEFTTLLWPLSWIVSFRPRDHLKNGEGSNQVAASSKHSDSLVDRVFRLVADRTKGAFVPNPSTHSIFLLTQLTYYGYCFNPVSFYYIHNRSSRRIEAVIGEVSNTPWNEMHCYVLHPKAFIDQVQVTEEETTSSEGLVQTLHYTFPKRFHVSPFMEMSYNYEWTFTNFEIPDWSDETFRRSNAKIASHSLPHPQDIHVINSLRPLPSSHTEAKPPSLQFRARMQVERYSMHPFRIAYYLSMFPMYCMIVQIWIHVQAFFLFAKGVAYQPHPTGAETWASRIIGTAMVPLFALQDQCRKLCTNNQRDEKKMQKQKAL